AAWPRNDWIRHISPFAIVGAETARPPAGVTGPRPMPGGEFTCVAAVERRIPASLHRPVHVNVRPAGQKHAPRLGLPRFIPGRQERKGVVDAEARPRHTAPVSREVRFVRAGWDLAPGVHDTLAHTV